MDSKVSRGWKPGLRLIPKTSVRRGIAVLLSAGAIATVAYFTASTWAIRHESITFYDASRDNRPVAVDIAVRRDREMQASAGMIRLPVRQASAWLAEGLRTIPPRENGGNMDVKAIQVGTTILFPVLVDGAGLWTGDIHFAQGDGEVCGTAIEIAARVTLKCEVVKGAGSSIRFPHVIGGGQLRNVEPSRFHAVIGLPVKDAGWVPPHLAYLDSPKIAALRNLSEDLTLATRDALLRIMVIPPERLFFDRERALKKPLRLAQQRVVHLLS